MTKPLVIVTLSTPEIRGYAHSTEWVKRRYCKKNGYSFACFRDRLDSRPAAWSKVVALAQCFETVRAEWYFWLDADALIMNDTIRLESFLDDRADLIISCDNNGINSGSFILRRNERTRKFLETVNNRANFTNHPWWDQAAMTDVLLGGESNLTVKYLPQRSINSYKWNFQFGDFVIHFAGLSHAERVQSVNSILLGVEFASRSDLIHLIDKHCRTNPVGAEVGVLQGQFSKLLLSSIRFERFYCIDAWQHIPGRRDISNLSDDELEAAFLQTKECLKDFGNVQMLREFSSKAVAQFRDESLDFVYLDADHSYHSSLADITAFYKKLKPGGIIAGHDYINGEFVEGEFGVKRAVDEFIFSNDIDNLFVTSEEWPTWLIIKAM